MHVTLINTIYAFTQIDKDGHEGIIGMNTPSGWRLLIGADMARMEELRAVATGIAQRDGVDVRLVHFRDRIIVERILAKKS